MARQARRYLETSFFHIMVQGINKEYIFKNVRYMSRYISLLRENLKESNVKIISFCIMDNHSHLLIQVEDIENLSKYMQKVNSSYAKYYNYMEDERVGYVFRDRYKSEAILDRRQLIQCVKYIHENPVKAKMVNTASDYKFSSYNYFNRNKLNHTVFTKEEMEYICNQSINCNNDFLDVDKNIEDITNDAICEFIKKENIKVFEIFEKSDILKKLIRFLKKDKNIKYTEIMEEFDITKGTMERLKK